MGPDVARFLLKRQVMLDTPELQLDLISLPLLPGHELPAVLLGVFRSPGEQFVRVSPTERAPPVPPHQSVGGLGECGAVRDAGERDLGVCIHVCLPFCKISAHLPRDRPQFLESLNGVDVLRFLYPGPAPLLRALGAPRLAGGQVLGGLLERGPVLGTRKVHLDLVVYIALPRHEQNATFACQLFELDQSLGVAHACKESP